MGYRNNRKSANLIIQGGIISITLLIANLCMLLRQIPLTAIWGDTGNSIYSAAYELYGFSWLLAAYALPYTVSYLIKPRLKQGQYKNAGRILKAAFLYATIVGGALSALLFFAGSYLTKELMLEATAGLTLQILSIAVLLSAWNGVLRGFYIGNGAGFPVVLSILIEQLSTLIAGMILSKLLTEYGTKVGALLQNEIFRYSFAVAGFAAGILTGAALSFLLLLVLYLLTHSYYKRKNGKSSGRDRESMLQAVYVLLICLLPMVLYGLLTRGYLLAQQLMFRQFMKDGLSMTVIAKQWGCYFGKYKILTALPVAIAAAMGSSLRDKIYAYYKKGDYQHMREQIQSMFKAIMLVVIPLSVTVGMLAEPLLELFGTKQDIETGALLLLTGFITAVFFSAAYLLAEILWGMKKQLLLLLSGAAAFAIQLGALYVMLEILHLDILGVLYADMIYSFSLMLLMGIAVQRQCRIRSGFLKANIPAAVSAAVMGAVQYLLAKVLSDVLPAGGALILLLLLGTLLYFLLLLLLHSVSERELRLIPGGRWIAAAARAVRLL